MRPAGARSAVGSEGTGGRRRDRDGASRHPVPRLSGEGTRDPDPRQVARSRARLPRVRLAGRVPELLDRKAARRGPRRGLPLRRLRPHPAVRPDRPRPASPGVKRSRVDPPRIAASRGRPPDVPSGIPAGGSSHEPVLDAWRVSCRATAFLVERLPDVLWPLALPGAPRRTVRSVAVHLHNCRRLWMNGLGKLSGIAVPPPLGRATASRAEVLDALASSGDALLRLLRAALENGGPFPGVGAPFVFGALPRDAVLFCAYAVSHEAHHRGQLVALRYEALGQAPHRRHRLGRQRRLHAIR
ncbi:hypothetical protein FBQ97_18950 [Acidobacteria bacterium ACD]|nr:hypothetical protein [Acidobacteria bacterium ACD]